MALTEEQRQKMRERLRARGLLKEEGSVSSIIDDVRKKRELVRAKTNTANLEKRSNDQSFFGGLIGGRGRVEGAPPVRPLSEATEQLEEEGLKKPFSERLEERKLERAGELVETEERRARGETGFLSGAFQKLGTGAAFLGDVAGEVLTSAVRLLPDDVELRLRESFREDLANDPAAQLALEKLGEASKLAEEFGKDHPNTRAALRLGTAVLEGTGLASITKKAITKGKDLLPKLKEKGQALSGPLEKRQLDEVSEIPFESKVDDLPEGIKDSKKSDLFASDSPLGVIRDTRVYNQRHKDFINNLIKEAAPETRAAIKQGVDIPTARNLARSTDEELALAEELATTAKKQMFADEVDVDVKQLAGQHIRKPIQFLERERAKAGDRLQELAQRIETAEVGPVKLKVFDDLKTVPGLKGLRLKTTREGQELDFSRTTVSRDLSAQRTISKFFDDLARLDPEQLHLRRQELFEELGGKKSAGIVLKGTEEAALSKIRESLMRALDDALDDYRELNKDYAVIENTLKRMRKNFRPVEGASDDILDIRATELARRLTGEASAVLRKDFQDIDTLARQLGYKSDIRTPKVQDFMNILARYYKIIPPTGIEGVISRAIPRGLRDIPGKVVEKGIDLLQIERTENTVREALEEYIGQLQRKAREIDTGRPSNVFSPVDGDTKRATKTSDGGAEINKLTGLGNNRLSELAKESVSTQEFMDKVKPGGVPLLQREVFSDFFQNVKPKKKPTKKPQTKTKKEEVVSENDILSKVSGVKKLPENKLYHGTSANNLESISEKGFIKGSELPEDAFRSGGFGELQDSVSFSTSPKQASVFTGDAPEGVVIEVKLKKGTKIANITDDEVFAEDLNKFIPQLKEQGFDGVFLPAEDEVVVFDPKKVLLTGKNKRFKVFEGFDERSFVED